jgi:hypothetical protein
LSRKISITLDDEAEAALEAIRRLSGAALIHQIPATQKIVQRALRQGLRRDLATMRRAATLSKRWT